MINVGRVAGGRPTGLMLSGLLCLLAGCVAASAEVWPQGRKAKSAQYHTQDSVSGAYQYGYTGPHHAKSESSFNGVTRGGYSYIDANGLMQTVSYTADAENGFRVQASNLPNGNSLSPVQDTPEVAVARKRHLEQFRKADAMSWQDPQQLDEEQQEDEYRVAMQQFRPRQYRPSQYRRQQQQQQQQLQPQQPMQQLQQRQLDGEQVQPQQQRQLEEEQLQQQPKQLEGQQLQQQQRQLEDQQQQYHARQRARQVSVEPRYLLSAEEARKLPAPRPSNANAIVVEAAKAEPVPVPTRFSAASATLHRQHHLIVPAMFAVPMPLVHSSMRHTQDSLGQYEYSYTGDTSAKTESRSLDGTTRGAYSYIDANGLLQQVHYIADKDGFRVLATNLPQA